jgi:DnaJ-class molecular chaperone
VISPYVILGIPEGSPIEEVKVAYRKLAKTYHPDLNPENETAHQRFMEVQQAYDLITKEQAKPRFTMQSVIETVIEVTVEEAFHGAKKDITMRGPSGNIFTLAIDIPPQTLSGSRLKVRGLPDEFSMIDLMIVIVIGEQSVFRAMGTTIMTRARVDFTTAVLGGEVCIDTLDGKRFFQVPPGSQNGSMIKLAKLGFIIPHAPPGTRDDFVVILDIIIPTDLSDAKRAALEAFRDTP